jgi:acetyl esterase
MFYMHGGGFVFGCSEDTDYITRRLCLENDLVVISINYPLAPEAVFPLALDSCMQVMREVCRAQTHWNIDSKAVYVAGDSAGANLAAAVALQMKASGMTAAGLLMLAPWLDMHVESYESYNLLAPTGIVYDSPFIGYARAAYVSFSEWKNPLVSPIHCEPAQLPPSLIIIGTDDPFFDQAVSFEKAASKNGCAHIELVPYEGMPHCFYSLPGLFTEEEDCYKRIVPFIRKFVR